MPTPRIVQLELEDLNSSYGSSACERYIQTLEKEKEELQHKMQVMTNQLNMLKNYRKTRRNYDFKD